MPENLSDTQAADVLRRAALLQAQSDHARGVGLSLDEVKRAAEAAGIEGRFVEQAYLGAGEPLAPDERFMGIETGVRRSRVVPGHVSEHEWGQMVLALRREFGQDGEAETLGGVREWKAYQRRVQVESDGPNTRITASSEWVSDARAAGAGSILYAVGSAALLAFGIVPLAVLLLVAALLHAGYAWGPVRARARTRGPQLDRAMDTLERIVGADERTGALEDAPTPHASGEGRMDPSLLDAEPLPDTETARQRLRE